MKAYLLMTGEYADAYVLSTYAKKEDADRQAQELNKDYTYEEYYVEETASEEDFIPNTVGWKEIAVRVFDDGSNDKGEIRRLRAGNNREDITETCCGYVFVLISRKGLSDEELLQEAIRVEKETR